MQETWDENDWIKEREDGYTVFHHNNDSKQSRTGVAIILSPRYSKAWKTAGGLDPIQPPKGKFEGRFIGLCLQFPVLNAKGFPVKNKNIRVALATVYHPYDDTYSEFNSLLDDLIEKLPPSKGIIMGGDMNATIGIRDCEALNNVLGPYGMPKRNEKDRDLLQTYQSNNLRIMNTFFKSQTHVLHASINEQKTKYMLDKVAVSKSLFKNITDCRVTNDGIWSDHSALRTEIEMFSCEFSSSAIGAQSTELDQRKLLSENKAAYNSRVTELLSQKKEATGKYEAYMEILEQAAIKTSSAPPKVDRAWFDYD